MDAPALLVAARFVSYAGAAVLCGAGLAWWRLAPRLAPSERSAWNQDIRRAAWLAVAALVLARLATLYAQTAWFFGPEESVSLETMALMANETTWGLGWWTQMGSVALAMIWLAVPATSAVPGIGLAVFALTAATLPGTGHALETGVLGVELVAQALHAVAASVWIGGVILLLVAVFGAARRDAWEHRALGEIVETLSPVALVCAGLLAATGAFTAWRYVGSFATLLATTYGRVLLGKLALVALVLLLGYRNWRVVTPRLGDETGTGALRATAGGEVGFAAAVQLATAVLVGLPMPMG